MVQRALRFTFFALWAVVMTALTYVLGAPPLKVLRRRIGRVKYWTLITVVSTGLYLLSLSPSVRLLLDARLLAVVFFSMSVLIGVFDEFEEMGFSFLGSSFFTLLINGLISAGAFALWVFRVGPNWSQNILSSMETALKPVSELNPHFQVNLVDLMIQLPSIAIILWMFAIYLAVLLESRLNTGEMAAPTFVPSLKPQLATMKLPDACVWIFIASLLGTFADFHIRPLEVISVNLMNISLVLFFFQGIAVVNKVFVKLRVGFFWQALFMVLFVLQLFLFVSLLGLMDYWLNFRTRLEKRPEEIKRET